MNDWRSFEAAYPLLGRSLRMAKNAGRLGHSHLVPLLPDRKTRLPRQPFGWRHHKPDIESPGIRDVDELRLHGHGRADGQLRRHHARA